MNKRIVLLAGLIVATGAIAKDFGTWGDVYPIQETDLLQTFITRLQTMQKSGELEQHQEAFKQRVMANGLRPQPVDGLVAAQTHRSWSIDPSFVVKTDIADHRGRVFARAGQRVNPLASLPFRQTLYFIDADDLRQVSWVQAQQLATPLAKVILVKGNIREAAETLQARIYFDQQGVLSKRFGLHAVPARVTPHADGLRLQVDEFAMEGGR